MFLGAMQECITGFYGLEIDYDVYDFLITDRKLARSLGAVGRRVDEQLLIAESDGAAEVSLYLEQDLVERLERNDPTTNLNPDNLPDFLTAFEGVSHFTYFVYKASNGHCVTLLELELQAEVDKFVAASLYWQQQGEAVPSGLHSWLFELPRFDDALTPAEQERYEWANRYAARYCRKLGSQLHDIRGVGDVRRELRQFYRLPRQDKIGHIHAQ